MKVKNRIKIIIADDHAFFRKGLASVIHDNENYELIGEAADGEELFQLLNCKIPDIILMDVQMPGMDGMEITRNIIKKFPLIRIIALTAFDEDDVIRNMMKAGAYSFLDKNISKEEVYHSIDTVIDAKEFYFPAKIRKRAFQLMEDQPKYGSGMLKKDFSDREIDIIRLTCQDLSLKEIAENLGISPRTVETHRTRIMDKMEVKSAAGIVAYAFTHKLFMRSK